MIIKKCEYCNSKLFRKNLESKRDFLKRRFCGVTCSNLSKAGNKIYFINDQEFIKIVKNSSSYNEIAKKVGYRSNGKTICELIKSRISDLNLNFVTGFRIQNLDKGSLFKNRNSWQNARSTVAKHARKVMEQANIPKICIICSYSLHVHVCHIRPVQDFNSSVLIRDINSIDNLVYLCPNHHWELDNGFLKI